MSSSAKSGLLRQYFYKAKVRPNGNLACYTLGYNTRVKSYWFAIQSLRQMGYDVLVFEYDNQILRGGQPDYLIDVVEEIVNQVDQTARDYQEVLCLGVSLGGFIGYNVLKRVKKAVIGAFADCGVDFVPLIFSSYFFKDMAKAYLANGYNEPDLNRIWKPLDVEPAKASFPKTKSFIVFDGTRDRLINFHEAKSNIESWAAKGIRVKQYPLRGRGHLTTGIYFIRHTRKIVTLSKQYHHTKS